MITSFVNIPVELYPNCDILKWNDSDSDFHPGFFQVLAFHNAVLQVG